MLLYISSGGLNSCRKSVKRASIIQQIFGDCLLHSRSYARYSINTYPKCLASHEGAGDFQTPDVLSSLYSNHLFQCKGPMCQGNCFSKGINSNTSSTSSRDVQNRKKFLTDRQVALANCMLPQTSSVFTCMYNISNLKKRMS